MTHRSVGRTSSTRASSTISSTLLSACLIALSMLALGSAPHGQAAGAPPQRPTFRASSDLVSIDVVVRDRNGNLVRDLRESDFEIREDGKPQDLLTFAFQEINARTATTGDTALLGSVEARAAASPDSAAPAPAAPLSPAAVAGRRLIVLLFDLSSMQPEDVQRSIDAANDFVARQMGVEDLVAVATVSSTLDLLSDFSGDKQAVAGVLGTLAITDGTAAPTATAGTAATDEAALAATEAAATEFESYNNDARLRALRVLAEALTQVEQKKAVIYFSAGMERSGADNLVELRAATNAAVRANLSIYPVDARGLQAVVPGGDARQASRGGVALFSGRGVGEQFDKLAASQDSLVSLAADTGGQAFTDTNDFGGAFRRVQRDISAYYLLGYSSTNTARDGRFRRIQVRVRRDGLRVEARNGYYAERDFANTNRTDREAQLQEQLNAGISTTDLPVLVGTGFFRMAADRYYVPIAVAVPGASVPVGSSNRVSVDVIGQVRDEQGRAIGKLRETMQVPGTAGGTLAGKQVLYQAGVMLPPGRFAVKVVVRENTNGTIGSFEVPLVVPELKTAPLKVSSVVMSTQVEPWNKGRSDNPLIRDGLQLLPNLTRVVGSSQRLYFYYEVYEPATEAEMPPLLRTSLAFYRGKVKVLETPVVERTTVDVPERQASLFQFELAPASLAPGLYTCQINIVDAVGGRFSFPRLSLLVR